MIMYYSRAIFYYRTLPTPVVYIYIHICRKFNLVTRGTKRNDAALGSKPRLSREGRGWEVQGIPGGLISKRKCLREGGGGDRLDVVSRDVRGRQ